MAKKFTIKPTNEAGSYRETGLEGVTYKEICEVLGFKPNVKDDPNKVKYSWGFTINGEPAGIWDYKGSHKYNSWSVFNPTVLELFKK
jgi:hypothetical protein